MAGHEILKLHDYGGCGRVYRMVDVAGVPKALKVFDDLSVCRSLLVRMSQRLSAGGWPDGVMPWLTEQLDHSPLYVVMPWVADDCGGVEHRPRSLQHVMSAIGRHQAWVVIRALAAALARMHARHVPHGNLKPGNVFLDNGGGVIVSDWCLGNMPGVHLVSFTDALLYQPPEQLTAPSGFLDEQGYGWDVFSFGVLAFRLLTGHFPRCDEVFSRVAPHEGVTRCEGLKADPQKLARNLKAAPAPAWPSPAADEAERLRRDWIVRCLEIEPTRRPSSMVEVVAGLDWVETEMERGMQLRRLGTRIAWWRAAACGLLVVTVGLFVALAVSTSHTRDARASGRRTQVRAADDRGQVEAVLASARGAQQQAEQARDKAIHALEDERRTHLEQLQASRLVGDRLFAWAMENGPRRLPPLDGQKLRLLRLENYFKDFLKASADNPALADERARVSLQLAEIALSDGNAAVAVARFDEALAHWSGQPMDAAMRLRLATNRLRLAMLRDERGDPLAKVAYEQARAALTGVPRGAVDADRRDQLLAVLEFREAKLLALEGDETRALDQLMRATQVLNRIAERRPDVAILRSALADCYLSSAAILEGLGSVGDAREVRKLACDELERQLRSRPDEAALQYELAACHAAMADAAVLSGDSDEAARRAGQGLKLLDTYLKQIPRDDGAQVRKGALLGLQAGIHRDRGEIDKAVALYGEAMRMLEAVHEREPGHALASYHLAMIWWQKARMSGGEGRGGDTELMRRASLLLDEVAEAPGDDGPRPEQLKRSRAYLAGDLGHAFELKQQPQMARRAFSEAVGFWQGLLQQRPQNEEYHQGLEWCRGRLESLK